MSVAGAARVGCVPAGLAVLSLVHVPSVLLRIQSIGIRRVAEVDVVSEIASAHGARGVSGSVVLVPPRQTVVVEVMAAPSGAVVVFGYAQWFAADNASPIMVLRREGTVLL